MPIDSSIYFQQQTPDLFGNYLKGVSLRKMANEVNQQDKQISEQDAIKNAYAKGVVQGPNGQVMQDRGKTLTELLKVNPMAAYQQQKQFESDDLMKNQAMVKTNLEKIDLASRLLSGVKDQESFDQAIDTGKKLGIDTSAMGKYYDPNLVNRYQMMSLSAKENLDKQFKDLDYQIKSRGLDITQQNNLANQRAKQQELNLKANPVSQNNSIFDRERQKQAAKDYQLIQKNAVTVSKNIGTVDDAIDSMEQYSKKTAFGTGPIATAFGMRKYTDQDLENLNAKLKAVNLKNMTTTFSGMAKAIDSDAERRAWNGTQADIANDDVTNMNILLAQRSILMKDKAEANAQKEYVVKNGSLDGYQSPIDGKVKTLISQDGEMALLPNEQFKQAQKQGFMTLDQFSRKSIKKSTPQSTNATQSMSKPQTVIQNGFTYTLNPQTGQYE